MVYRHVSSCAAPRIVFLLRRQHKNNKKMKTISPGWAFQGFSSPPAASSPEISAEGPDFRPRRVHAAAFRQLPFGNSGELAKSTTTKNNKKKQQHTISPGWAFQCSSSPPAPSSCEISAGGGPISAPAVPTRPHSASFRAEFAERWQRRGCTEQPECRAVSGNKFFPE